MAHLYGKEDAMDPFKFAIVSIVLAFAALLAFGLIRHAKNAPELRELTLEIHIQGGYCSVTSPQLPGKSTVGQSDTAAIGQFIRYHGEHLGIRVVVDDRRVS